MTRAIGILATTAVLTTTTLADDSGGAPAKPLYLHWFQPEYGEGDRVEPARHLVTVRVSTSSDFRTAFSDPTLPARTVVIQGRLELRNGKHTGVVAADWRSSERFSGEFELDRVRGGTIVGFSGAVWSTAMVLSNDPVPTRFLGSDESPVRNEED